MRRWYVIATWLAACGCAHRPVGVTATELERTAGELHAKGEAEVRTSDGDTTTLHSDERVQTRSGEARVGFWVGRHCEPSGACHFDGEGVTIERVDTKASWARGAMIAGGVVAVGAVAGGVACGAGMICDSDASQTAGAITLGVVGAALVVGIVALATCKTCWVTR